MFLVVLGNPNKILGIQNFQKRGIPSSCCGFLQSAFLLKKYSCLFVQEFSEHVFIASARAQGRHLRVRNISRSKGQEHSMDAYHFAGAAGGLQLGIWLKTGSRELDVRPCICHCAVSSPERSTGEGAWLWLVCFGLVGLFVTNLALAFRVSFLECNLGSRSHGFRSSSSFVCFGL